MSNHPQLDRPPILIGGCGRSGTSLLLSILSAHPAILAIPHETEAFCPTAWSGSFDPQAPFKPEVIAAYLDSVPIPPTARRWAEKSPKNVLFFGRILEYFGPGVRLIHLVRDGRDVVTSFHPTRRREKPWVSPERWVRDVSAGREVEGHPQVHLVRYEDLVQDFGPTIRKLCAFLEEEVHLRLLDWHAHATVREHVAWAGEVGRLHAGSVGKWRDPKFKVSVEGLLALPGAEELLRRYGYL